MSDLSYSSLLSLDSNAGANHPDIPYLVIGSLICALGLFGNLVAIFVIVVLKEYQKSVTHWYVLQLAVADTIFLVTWPFKLRAQYLDAWIFSEWMCKANETILFLNYYASIIFLVVMSIDRYIAVCQTFSPAFQKLRKRTSAFIVAMCVWGSALALTIPVMLYSHKVGTSPKCHCTYEFDKAAALKRATCHSQEYQEGSEGLEACLNVTNSVEDIDNGELHCRKIKRSDIYKIFRVADVSFEEYGEDVFGSYSSGSGEKSSGESNGLNPNCHYFHHSMGWKLFLGFNFVVMFIIPFFIMLICYGLIVRRLYATRMRATSTSSSASFTHSISGNSGGSQKKRRKSSARSDKDRRRVTIMCATLVISFTVCWVPFHSIHLAKFQGLFHKTNDYCQWIERIGSVFVYLSAAVNPYLYSFLGTHFLKRWQFATTTVRKSMRRRISSSSGGGIGSVRYAHNKKPERENSTSHNQTLMTKVNKLESNAVSESKPMTFIATNYPSEMRQNKHPSSEDGGTPPPDYERSLTMNEEENAFKN